MGGQSHLDQQPIPHDNGCAWQEDKTNNPAKNYFGARQSRERDPDAMDIDAMTTEK